MTELELLRAENAQLRRDLAQAIQAAEPNARALVLDGLARRYHDDYERGGLLGAVRVGNELLELALTGPGVNPAQREIVINVAIGGFALSRAAIVRARELSGDPTWGGPVLIGDLRDPAEPPDAPYNRVEEDYGTCDSWVQRDDPVLLQVVKELGPAAADADLCELAIVPIPAEVEFHVCDSGTGAEWIAEAHRTWHGPAPRPRTSMQCPDCGAALTDWVWQDGGWKGVQCPGCGQHWWSDGFARAADEAAANAVTALLQCCPFPADAVTDAEWQRQLLAAAAAPDPDHG
jgi:hypothetical protein